MISLVLQALLLVVLLLVWLRIGARRKPDGFRQCIPLNSGGQRVKPGVACLMTACSQRGAIEPQRLVVSNGSTKLGAADWLINDISIDGRSQFAQSGQVPGDMFAINAVDILINFDTAPRYAKIAVSVSYVGTDGNGEGVPFYGSILGDSLTDREAKKRIRRMERREKLELAAYSRLRADRVAAENVAKRRLEAEAELS